MRSASHQPIFTQRANNAGSSFSSLLNKEGSEPSSDGEFIFRQHDEQRRGAARWRRESHAPTDFAQPSRRALDIFKTHNITHDFVIAFAEVVYLSFRRYSGDAYNMRRAALLTMMQFLLYRLSAFAIYAESYLHFIARP